ncbi:MAG TPA: hypothetical protein VFI65_24015 [Streptosporangiaceae bacterium]|nr:hypothetical protein [Streptosporangiaceae bacterium]
MPRRIGRFLLHRLRCYLTIHEPEIWEFLAAMAYASPVVLFPYPELARNGRWAPYDAYAWLGIHGEPGLTRRERRIWLELSQELGVGPVQASQARLTEGPPS